MQKNILLENKNKAMENNILEINHFKFGIERFVIDKPKYNLYKSKSGAWKIILSFTTSKAINTSKALEELVFADPYFEAIILLNNNLTLKRGNVTQKQGYDYENDENSTIFYYFDYQSIEEIKIKLLEVTKDFIIADIQGKTIINGSNGNNPDAELSIRKTTFMLDKKLNKSFS